MCQKNESRIHNTDFLLRVALDRGNTIFTLFVSASAGICCKSQRAFNRVKWGEPCWHRQLTDFCLAFSGHGGIPRPAKHGHFLGGTLNGEAPAEPSLLSSLTEHVPRGEHQSPPSSVCLQVIAATGRGTTRVPPTPGLKIPSAPGKCAQCLLNQNRPA